MAVSTVSSFLALKLYSRYLDADGTFAVAVTAQQLIGQVSILDGGFRMATNRAMLAEVDEGKKLRTAQFAQTLTWLFGATAALAGAITLAFFSLAPNAAKSGVSVQFLLSFGLMGGGALACFAQVQMLVGLGLQRRIFSINALNSIMFLAVVWMGLKSHLGLWALLLALVISQGISGTLAVLIAKAAMPELRIFRLQLGEDFRAQFRLYSRDAWAALRMQVATAVLYTSDAVVVNWVCQGAVADAYLIPARLFNVLRLGLQSADESLWPLIAAGEQKATQVSGVLLRANGWLYGAAMSAAAVTLPVFIASYMPEKAHPGTWLVALFSLRYLIVGLATQPSFYLQGTGRFDLLQKFTWRELAAALVFSIPLGLKYGAMGVAGGYLLATAAGTLWSVPKSYADGTKRPIGEIFGSMWLRALLGATVAAGTSLAVLRFGQSWVIALGAGAAGGGTALLWAGGWAWWRTGVHDRFPGASKLAAQL